MRRYLTILLALVACRDDANRDSAKSAHRDRASGSADTSRTGSGTSKTGSAAANKTGADPWQVRTDPDAPPTLDERYRLAQQACPTIKAPYFYRIEKGGKVSHILGTRHIGVPLTKFPRAVHSAIESAKLAIFEVAPDDHADTPSKEVSLPDELGPNLWSRYQALVGKETAQMVATGAPSTAMIALMVMYEDIGSTLDAEIERKVVEKHIPARGLERGSFQDKLLDKLLDLRMLRAAIEHTKDRAELAKDSRDDLAEYCAGTDTTPGMDEDMRADLLAAGYTNQELDQIDELMVFSRNEDWIPKLEKILATNNVFIAVGADHLSGPRGVVALLEKRGYKLTRVTN